MAVVPLPFLHFFFLLFLGDGDFAFGVVFCVGLSYDEVICVSKMEKCGPGNLGNQKERVLIVEAGPAW